MPPSGTIIRVAKSAGFCFGVRRAIDLALQTARSDGEVYMLGAIVHNEHVVRQIRQAGIKTVTSLDEVGSGTLLLRAHGVSPAIYRQAELLGLKLVDATCPLVKEIHHAARELEKEGYQIVILGDHFHDEVVGIAGQVQESVVFSSPREVLAYQGPLRKIGVVVQSTQEMEKVRQIIHELLPRCHELKFINTICKPTKDHQQEICCLPLENDVIVIVGSFTSANTTRLTQIAAVKNPRTYQVESSQDLQPSWFADAHTVGISAGASTPDWILQQVVHRIVEITAGEVVPNHPPST